MSGRQPEELDRLFKRVPNLGLIAENGCFLKEFGSSKWIEMADPEKMRAWKESVEGIMEYYHERTPGSSHATAALSSTTRAVKIKKVQLARPVIAPVTSMMLVKSRESGLFPSKVCNLVSFHT